MHRPKALIAFALILAAAAPASAARKPPPKPKVRKAVCNLVTDPGGDAAYPAAQAPSQPALDIVGGDVVSDLKQVTAVIRLGGPGAADQTIGWTMRFRFAVAGNAYYLAGSYDPVSSAVNGITYDWGIYDAKGGLYKPQGHVGGKFDSTKHELHVTALFADLHVSFPDSALVNGLGIGVWSYPVPYFGIGLAQLTDSAESAKTYNANWPSCIKAGA
jgi:hypothetical protein